MNQKIQTSVAHVQDWSDPEKKLNELLEDHERRQRLSEDTGWYERMMTQLAERKVELARREAAKAARDAADGSAPVGPAAQPPASPTRRRRGSTPATPVSPSG